MFEGESTVERLPVYCSLCISRCGAVAVVENGRFTALEPDPSHPTGKALCAKGRAAPELVYHPDRLRYPLKRTQPKGDPDPGWERISWEEAMDLTASKLRQIADAHGPESVVFSAASPSTTAIDDVTVWIERLMNAYGSPNLCNAMELCGWGRFGATMYTFGASVPGAYFPDLENAGCILFWGYNPNLARLVHATMTVDALKRGARLIVVDPRQTGIAKKADIWLRVRPGTDAALALGIANVMIDCGWYDEAFLRDWTDGPLLVRSDTGRWLTQADLHTGGSDRQFAAWDEALGEMMAYDAVTGYSGEQPALRGEYRIETPAGEIMCKPVFELLAEHCQRYPADQVEAICGLEAGQVAAAAQLLWESRPVAYYAWSGVEMQTNSTQIARAIAQLSILTGSFDVPGGNVRFTPIPSADVRGGDFMPPEQRKKTLGLPERPMGPARMGFVTTDEVYRGVLEQQPYAVHGMVGFGSNLLLSHAGSLRGREALAALDFYVHLDLFMNPTAEMADIVLPTASAFEHAALKIGFDVSQAAQSRVQYRQPVAAPPGEARSDMEFIFDLAQRLGLGDRFWDGDIDAAYRYQLGPSGVSLEELRAHPGGVQLDLPVRYRKYIETQKGTPIGFNTPSRKIELYSQAMLEHGYPPLPEYEEPRVGPRSRPELAARFPLILTCTKNTLFCESQQRALPSLRRQALEPEVELHPTTAAARGIQPGDWVHIETPEGSVRARAKFNASLDPQVVCGQHGWWQACEQIGAPGYDPFTSEGANYNLLIGNAEIDPVSGSVPHRAYVCEVSRVE